MVERRVLLAGFKIDADFGKIPQIPLNIRGMSHNAMIVEL